MKTRRIASSLALAAVVALGATGCGLVAAQGTTVPYAPSDGIDVSLNGVDVRNMLLVADESGENFNVVFTAVNNATEAALLRVTFVAEDGAEASADFQIEPGLTAFGDPEGETMLTLVSIPNLMAGATIETYFEVAGGGEVKRQVPVLDGTLAEYQAYVVSASQLRAIEEGLEEHGDHEHDATETAEQATDAAVEAEQATEEAAAEEAAE